MAMADDPNDLDWVPARLHDKKGKLYLTYIHKSRGVHWQILAYGVGRGGGPHRLIQITDFFFF